jgi:hypothetical protein
LFYEDIKLEFGTYQAAEAFLQEHTTYQIVGVDPFSSPVSLDKIENYRLIYNSPTVVKQFDDRSISEVEIYEYVPGSTN